MASVIITESAQDHIRSRNASSSTCWDGGGTLTLNHSSSVYSPMGRFYLSDYRAYQTFGHFPLSSIPAGATITSVTGRYYLRVDNSASNFYMEMYEFNWGSSVSASSTDWQNRSELAALNSNGKLLASDLTTTMSIGWNDYVISPNFVGLLQAAVDAGDTYLKYVHASSDNRAGTTGTATRWIEISDATYKPQFTINYILPDLQTIQLGTTF